MSDTIVAVRAFYDVFATRNVDGFDGILASDWKALPSVPGNPGGREGQKGTVHYLHSVLADLSYTVDEIYACGPEIVACRCTLRGRQIGPFLGLSPTGAPIELMTIEFHYFDGGLIKATRHLEDFFGVHQALLAAGAQPVTAER
ncbi:MAG: ester cyclase [Bosea sp. (in: a-proteobacteria)]